MRISIAMPARATGLWTSGHKQEARILNGVQELKSRRYLRHGNLTTFQRYHAQQHQRRIG